MRELRVDLDGPARLVDHGGDGPPLLLVHGLGGSVEDWLAVAGELATRHRVLAIDLVGFGRTPLAGRRSDLGTNRDLILRCVDEVCEGPTIVVGNSMGGLLTLLAGAHRPDLVAATVLVNPALPRPWLAPLDAVALGALALWVWPRLGRHLLERRMRNATPEELVRATLDLCSAVPGSVDPAIVEELIILQRERSGSAEASEAFATALLSLTRVLTHPRRLSAAVRRVRAPGLIVHGAVDPLVPVAAATELHRLRPDWRLEVLDGVGHIPMLEAPQRLLDVVVPWLDAEARVATHPAA